MKNPQPTDRRWFHCLSVSRSNTDQKHSLCSMWGRDLQQRHRFPFVMSSTHQVSGRVCPSTSTFWKTQSAAAESERHWWSFSRSSSSHTHTHTLHWELPWVSINRTAILLIFAVLWIIYWLLNQCCFIFFSSQLWPIWASVENSWHGHIQRCLWRV